MAAYVGGRRHMTDFDYNRRFPDSITNRRLHYDDLDLNDNGRYSSRNRQWQHRRGFSEHELEGDFNGARETKLSTLQHQLEELKQDNRQMSLRLSEAEGCLQDLDSDGRMVHHSTSLIDDFDHSVNRPAERDRQRRLRRELNEIRDDLNTVRGSIQQPFTDDDHLYYDGGRHLSSPEHRRRLRHFRNYGNGQPLGEWGSKQLEQNTWTRQGSDLDPYFGSRRSYSPIRSISPTARSASCVGYRSVVPRPLVTQHNKFQNSPLTSRRYDAGYMNDDDAVFVPSSAADLSIGCRVKVSRNGGTSHGMVKYIGHLPGKVGPYLGLELENEAGKHDGIYNGFRYFQSKGYRAVFVPFDRVVLAWRH